jgi:hypothetical protein
VIDSHGITRKTRNRNAYFIFFRVLPWWPCGRHHASNALSKYPDTIAADLSPQRLQRIFVRIDERYHPVNKALREPIVFASQSLISDAPCSRSDRVSCPNLLASLEPEFEQKLIPPFPFALNESGYLLLGPAESIGPARPKRVNIPTAPAGKRRPPIPAGGAGFVRKLEHQLKGTHEDLQGTIEELESANEELEASMEESCR